MIVDRRYVPLHGPRCFKLTLWPPHCARIRWHRVAYVWLSVPHTARAFDSSHSPPFAVQLKIYRNKYNVHTIGQNWTKFKSMRNRIIHRDSRHDTTKQKEVKCNDVIWIYHTYIFEHWKWAHARTNDERTIKWTQEEKKNSHPLTNERDERKWVTRQTTNCKWEEKKRKQVRQSTRSRMPAADHGLWLKGKKSEKCAQQIKLAPSLSSF